MLAEMLDTRRFPAVAAVSHQAFDDDDICWEEVDFRFYPDRLLGGYAQHLRYLQP